MRLNVGSGWFPLEGWTNIDQHAPADIQGDFRNMTFRDVDEINASHLLEHVSWRETGQVLSLLRSWLRDGGKLTVEVPDMQTIMRQGPSGDLWLPYVYGSHEHDGEHHKAGFTKASLDDALRQARYRDVTARRFPSANPVREGMPCVEAVAYR